MLCLDHVALPASDMDAALRFYGEVLDLKFMFREVDPMKETDPDNSVIEFVQWLDR